MLLLRTIEISNTLREGERERERERGEERMKKSFKEELP